ncbi:MAG: adenylyl-sulfate kinase [Pseudonocardiales bacterium]|nr:MAG: adenylyl-sulfate kinase [Pseudonocardiales bacterium]
MDAASWTPDDAERADLELLLSGAFSPLQGFLDRADTESVRATGRLADGTEWPVPVVLQVPDELAGAPALTLTDPEGAPLARLAITEAWPAGRGRQFVAGPVAALAEPAYGTFRSLHLTPAQVREQLGSGPVLATVAGTPLHCAGIAGLRAAAECLDARTLLLIPTGTSGDEPLVRAVLAAAAELPGAVPVAVALRSPDGSAAHALLGAHVAAAYGATHLLAAAGLPGAPLPVVPPTPAAQPALSDEALNALLDAGAPLPAGFTPAAVERELRRTRRPLTRRGLVVLFTGLSGSGKSTLARGLHDTLLERGDRTTTLLDGDVVRRMLSAGLGFSRADRDLNITRIGYVAAEAARHGGVAICAPIAPYASTRAAVRAMAEAAGDFVLVWVSTPLERCEARDRKGLYARARAGGLPGFTGIDDPYEEPLDADVVIDTSDRPIGDCVAEVVTFLRHGGWLSDQTAVTP